MYSAQLDALAERKLAEEMGRSNKALGHTPCQHAEGTTHLQSQETTF